MVLICGARVAVMEAERATDGARPRGGGSYAELKGGALIRELLVRAGLSQRGAARELEVDERTMRRWCADATPAPKVAVLALEHLVCLRGQVSER